MRSSWWVKFGAAFVVVLLLQGCGKESTIKEWDSSVTVGLEHAEQQEERFEVMLNDYKSSVSEKARGWFYPDVKSLVAKAEASAELYQKAKVADDFNGMKKAYGLFERERSVVSKSLASMSSELNYLKKWISDDSFKKQEMHSALGLAEKSEYIESLLVSSKEKYPLKAEKIDEIGKEIGLILSSFNVQETASDILKFQDKKWISQSVEEVNSRVQMIESLGKTEMKIVVDKRKSNLIKVEGEIWDANNSYDHGQSIFFSERKVNDSLFNRALNHRILQGIPVRIYEAKNDYILAEITYGESKSFIFPSYKTHAALWIASAYQRYEMKFKLVGSEGQSREFWEEVTEEEFFGYQKGQAVYSKPIGSFRDEVYEGFTGLVGNKEYGQWRTDDSGMSFWEWYGVWSFANNLMGGNNIHYRYDRYEQNHRPNPLYKRGGVNYGTYKAKRYSGDLKTTRIGSVFEERSNAKKDGDLKPKLKKRKELAKSLASVRTTKPKKGSLKMAREKVMTPMAKEKAKQKNKVKFGTSLGSKKTKTFKKLSFTKSKSFSKRR